MNVQQSQHVKITLLAAILLLAAALVCLPQTAFADVVGENGGIDNTTEDLQKQTSTEPADNTQQANDDKKTNADPQQETTQQPTSEPSDPKEDVKDPAEPAQTDEASGTVEVTLADGSKITARTAKIEYLTAQDDGQELTALSSRSSTSNVGLSYNTHVQYDGWQAYVTAGKTSGTTGRALRLEGIHIALTGMGDNTGHIYYQTHVQYDGWQAAVCDGAMSGTEGRALRLEGIKIWLTGDIANHYDIFYRTHVQNEGWQGWQKNGAVSGTTGRSLRLEAIEIKLSPKTEEAAGRGINATGARYEAHVQNIGWQEWTGVDRNGSIGVAGTTGRGLRVEALNIVLSNGAYAGTIYYQAHVQNIGWQSAVTSGKTAGTTGRGLSVEALKIWLSGEIANQYDVYYRTHVQNYGWLDWAVNGQESGSTGHGLRVEALQIVLKKKGETAPGKTTYRTVNQLKNPLNGIDISSWQAGINIAAVPADFVIVKVSGGTQYVNPEYWSQASATINSGKMLGLYHFARESTCPGSAKAEATHFVNNVRAGGYIGRAILVLDWESSALSLGPGWAKEWLDEVYRQTGVRPMIYMSKSVTRSYNWSAVAPYYKLWVAQYPNYNTTGYQTNPWTDGYGYGAWSAPTMFQYASTGRLSGYGGNLDLNKFYGSQAEWGAIAARS